MWPLLPQEWGPDHTAGVSLRRLPNQVPQTVYLWLENSRNCCLSSEGQKSNPRCWLATFSPNSLVKDPSLPLWLLLVPALPPISTSIFRGHFPCVFLWPHFPLLMKIPVIYGIEASTSPMTSVVTPFPNRATLGGPGAKGFNLSFASASHRTRF